MKRLICMALLMVCFLTGCELFAEQEGLITFRLEEDAERKGAWEYFVQPEGALQKVRDEISEAEDGLLYHEWLFEGVQTGDASITFQYLEEGQDPERTVTYSCFVDEALHVGLLETVDSEDLVGTAEDELLARSVSAIIALELDKGLPYPVGQADADYVAEFLLQYVNLFCSEYAEDQPSEEGQTLVMSKEDVRELLDVAFGSGFDVDELMVDGDQYYFAEKDVAEIVAVAVGDSMDQLEYVFTLTGGESSVDGSALVVTVPSEKNSSGRSIASVSVQKKTEQEVS